MKILHVTTSFPSGPEDTAGVFVYRLIRALEKNPDIECTVLTPEGANAGNWPDAIEVIRFRYAWRGLHLLAQQPGGIPAALRKNPLKYLLLPSFFISMWRQVMHLASSHDIIHAHWSVSGFIASFAHPFCPKPLLTTLHGSDFNLALTKRIFRHVMYRAVAKSKFVAGVSRVMADNLKKLFPLYPEKFHFIPNGVDEDFFHIDISSRKFNNTMLFLFTGSIIPLKGVDILIEAFARLRNNTNDYKVIIAGDGPERKKFEELCRIKHIDDKIRFTGSLPPSQIPNIMQRANCLILPSYSEGRPSVVLEAMAAGLPVVATDIPGTNELIVDGENGWLFGAGDVDGLCRIIEEILNNPSSLAARGRRGRKMILENRLTWETTAQRYVELYKDMRAAC